MTYEEAADILAQELSKGGIDNPSHGLTQDNFGQYLIDPRLVEAEMDEGMLDTWIVFYWPIGDSAYAVGIDAEDRDFVFLAGSSPDDLRYIGSMDSLAEAINNI